MLVPDAVSGPAARWIVNESPTAAVHELPPDVNDAILRLPPVTDSAEETDTSIPVSCSVSSDPSCEPVLDTTAVSSTDLTSKLETLVEKNEPSVTVTLEPETSTRFAASVVSPLTPANDQSLIESVLVGPAL